MALDGPDLEVAPLLWSGSPAYTRRIATFGIRPEEAVRRAREGFPAVWARADRRQLTSWLP